MGKTNSLLLAPPWKNFGKIPKWPPLEKILPTPMVGIRNLDICKINFTLNRFWGKNTCNIFCTRLVLIFRALLFLRKTLLKRMKFLKIFPSKAGRYYIAVSVSSWKDCKQSISDALFLNFSWFTAISCKSNYHITDVSNKWQWTFDAGFSNCYF